MTEEQTVKKGQSLAFSFGDPEPVMSNNLADYTGTFLDIHGEYYQPPVSLTGLAKLMTANPHHNSILHFKKNMILKWFVPMNDVLSYNTLQKLALDYVVTGNAYPQLFKNAFGRVTRVGPLPAVALRRKKDANKYLKLLKDGSSIEFKEGEVLHLREPDLLQDIYGVPEYLGGIQSVMLSEDAGLFRRKYYLNGAHMGYILLTNDADLDDEDAKNIEKMVKQSKGPGNFRSMYINIGKSNAKEPVQVIPVGDIGTKDEFERIKNITKNEILSMHRMYPGLSGVMPENNNGFGDLQKMMEVYYELEAIPLQQAFLELNDLVGREIVRFKEPDWKKEMVA